VKTQPKRGKKSTFGCIARMGKMRDNAKQKKSELPVVSPGKGAVRKEMEGEPVSLITVEQDTCLDCGVNIEKSGARGRLRCGSCGTRYNDAVTQRRREGRMKIKKKGTIKYKGMETPMAVLVENVSFHGARIRYKGDTSLFNNRNTRGDSTLMVDVGELKQRIFAKVVWTAPVNDRESMAGLRFIWHS